MPTLHETAIHEAGHVVIARLCGVPVTHIEFTPDGADYEADGIATTYLSRVVRNLALFYKAVIFYAGFVAEQRVRPECTFFDSCFRTDRQKVNKALDGATRDTGLNMIAWTETAITAHWPEIEKLAAELVRCNGLYTDELMELGYYPKPTPVRETALMRAVSGR